ncbi:MULTISPECIES: GNAT family N-acetyltransferase [Pseudomonas]|uniref:N-acetyltransferase n=4 Tax=Pseudomonas TaxID=286 RepID=A0A3T0JWJ3_PSESX|nr:MULTISPECIES: GNAT family N-acetyltransferase [Pseudomonas]AZV27835.1 N-acetyltransferase [Pseudomonas syringae]NKF26720.1 GNAT family N-acetyltransferase [Pseudomonas sp. BG5]ABA75309.1 putative acetyltransferase [Pseudomonas fluorescens Pf0-1]AWA40267.1 N-acetyltransferase [Pseudomonas fluorescens]MBX8469347.1 GNAT family N-acetyltransferase [Pseudomonas sp. RIT778]
MTLRIELSQDPTEEQRAAILAPLRAHNIAKAGPSLYEPVALLVRDDNDAILGGLYGHTFYRWLFIELLAVPEEGRGQGIGSKLMNMVEEFAREKDCVGIWLDTFDFQAPGFYKKLGYTECGEIVDYPLGHKRHFFQKRLID